MAKANMDGKVCVNHPDTAAESRCTSCFKPICSPCIVEVENEDFCTKDCANKHFQNLAHQASLGSKSGGGLKTMIRFVIYIAILLALIFAVYHFVLKKGDTAEPSQPTPAENTLE